MFTDTKPLTQEGAAKGSGPFPRARGKVGMGASGASKRRCASFQGRCPHPAPPPLRRGGSFQQRGFTLIEVLVSIIIVAFGLIGVAGLLVKSASLGVSAHNRTLATQKVYNMVDRMRLNPAGVRAGSYNSLTGAPGSAPDCSAVCTPAQIASHDYAQWRAGIADALGDTATGTVQASGDQFTITVSWPERNFGLTAFNTQSYALDVRP